MPAPKGQMRVSRGDRPGEEVSGRGWRALAVVVALPLVVGAASVPGVLTARTPAGDRVEWRRGTRPVLLTLPKAGEGWKDLARRLSGDVASWRDLAAANPELSTPLRDVRVGVPWALLRGELRVAAFRAIFPADRRTAAGWEHVFVGPFEGESESWWELADLLCGEGSVYPALREANPQLTLYPARGDRAMVPATLLGAEFRAVAPEGGKPARTTAPAGEIRTPGAAAPAERSAVLEPGPPDFEPGPTPTATRSSPALATRPGPRATPEIAPIAEAPGGVLEYRDGEAIYRLRAGEALYSSVVVRFTGQLHASDVNATALELARRSGISDVTSIPVGYEVRIPFDLLLPEFLPPGNPRRLEWEKERQALAAIRRAIRAANLDGIHVILDAGHGGNDSGATVGTVWESTYTYDVMARVRRVLEKETRATVWTTVQDTSSGGAPQDRDELPPSRSQRLLVDPPFDLSDAPTGVHLRWILANAILARLEKQKVNPERVVFVSIHADSLHPSVRGMMVYVPSRSLRSSRGPNPASVYACRQTRGMAAPRFSLAFRSRSEALSAQLGEAIVRSAERYGIPVHPFQPVRSSVLRGRSRWVPAVLRYTEVPTAVLVEICNLNNEDDRTELLTWRFREKLAHAIAAGLAEGFSH
ncbi:MAG: N-acetylmuramoyl-L-alanine amidase [Acidobacteriota bacterium]